ncbi:hypothetical protein WJM97_18280 [Okeanomitos corallinicola TIOX110]|uniref:Uncharacterized protein n=1 Tax=Okeanomitos corallinicola TIOX110 TaxID=3133117 RepID=A0ABZ2UQM0_9CYAN
MTNSTSKRNHAIKIFQPTAWSKFRSSDLNLISQKSHDAVSEINDLVRKLSKVTHVKRVQAIAPNYPDKHWIEFELQLYPDTQLSSEAWDKVQDMVIDCEWMLRDKSTEDWYFHAVVVDKLSLIRDASKIVNDSYHLKSFASFHLNLVVS